MDREHLIAAQEGLPKIDEDEDGGAAALLGLLAAVAGPIAAKSRILDLGCGVGDCLQTMLGRGFDAYGADIYEYWDADRDLYWRPNFPDIPEQVRSRLRVATLSPYVLPFDDHSFDYIVSNQVLEHVDDLDALFSEIARTLRPGGTSLHMFPGRWAPPVESHISVPLPVLCHSRSYLKTMAKLGFRSPRQRGLGWRDVYRINREQMKITHYPPKSAILRKARQAGLDAVFIADVDNARPPVRRLHHWLTTAGMSPAARRMLMLLQQPRLLLRHRLPV